MKKKSFTLIELIVAMVLVGFVVASVAAVSGFISKKVNLNSQRYNTWSQINYTLDDMRIRCSGAIDIFTPIDDSGGSIVIDQDSGLTFEFEGEIDIYKITPDDKDDNARYIYSISGQDGINPGSLVLETVTSGVSQANVLVDGRFKPKMVLTHGSDAAGVFDEPNFITVTVEATTPLDGKIISKTEGLRFWFVDIVR